MNDHGESFCCGSRQLFGRKQRHTRTRGTRPTPPVGEYLLTMMARICACERLYPSKFLEYEEVVKHPETHLVTAMGETDVGGFLPALASVAEAV